MDALNTSYSYTSQAQGSTAGVQGKAAPEPIPEEAAAEVASQNMQVQNPVASDTAKNDAEGSDKQASDKQIEDAVKAINKHANGTEAIFGIHDKTNRVTIKIVDKKTKEVIKEVPPEKTLDLIAKAWEMAGLIVDDKR